MAKWGHRRGGDGLSVADLTASGFAPATVHEAQQILSECPGSTADSAVIRSNPCDRVKLPRIERREMLFLTPTEVATLADRIDERYRAFVLVGAYCGLRFGEMAGPRPLRIDLTRRRLDIAEIVTEVRGQHHTGPPKTRAGRRSVPVPPFVVDELVRRDPFPRRPTVGPGHRAHLVPALCSIVGREAEVPPGLLRWGSDTLLAFRHVRPAGKRGCPRGGGRSTTG